MSPCLFVIPQLPQPVADNHSESTSDVLRLLSAVLITPPGLREEENEIRRRMRAGDGVDHFETIRRRKDGTLRHVSLTISPVRDAQGRVIGASKIRVFQKKSPSGIRTSKRDVDLIARRLQEAKMDFEVRYGKA